MFRPEKAGKAFNFRLWGPGNRPPKAFIVVDFIAAAVSAFHQPVK